MARQFVQQDGINKLRYRFEQITERAPFEAVDALEQIGKDLKEKSQEVVLFDPAHDPEEGPHLRDTAYTGVFMGPDGPYVEVGYTKEYALRRHEELDVTPTTPGTYPKFLERPFNENRNRYVEMLLDRQRRLLRG
jgi:hypothetical protein